MADRRVVLDKQDGRRGGCALRCLGTDAWLGFPHAGKKNVQTAVRACGEGRNLEQALVLLEDGCRSGDVAVFFEGLGNTAA